MAVLKGVVEADHVGVVQVLVDFDFSDKFLLGFFFFQRRLGHDLAGVLAASGDTGKGVTSGKPTFAQIFSFGVLVDLVGTPVLLFHEVGDNGIVLVVLLFLSFLDWFSVATMVVGLFGGGRSGGSRGRRRFVGMVGLIFGGGGGLGGDLLDT